MTENTYDVVVIGGGAGGVPAAIRAAQLGGRVALIERDHLGGLCMNRGCIPFCHMMQASHLLGSMSLGKEMGLIYSNATHDYDVLMKRQNELISFLQMGVNSTLTNNKVEIIQGSGQITGKEKVEVNGQVISCRNIILAAGGSWRKPDIEGADLEGVINSDELLKEDSLPKRALLYGSSPWLVEIAQFLRRFGCEAILATEDKSILSHESKTIHARLKRALKDEGVEVMTGVHVSSAKKEDDGLHIDLDSSKGIQQVVADRLITVKRRAAINGLGLETVDLDESREYFEVDRKMQTEVKGIYAIGDLTAPPNMHYSHRASGQGIIAAENAMGENTSYKQKTVPRVLFTSPQVACVGLTPKEAKNLGYDVVVGSAPYSVNPFGMILSEETGIVEVVAEKRYGELLGAHFVGTSASEMVGQAVVAMHMEATLEDLVGMSFPHPTLSESLVEAAREALGRPIYLP